MTTGFLPVWRGISGAFPRTAILALIVVTANLARGGEETITVPVQLVNIASGDSNPKYKLGITIGLGGGAPKLYEFDTGAAGFLAAYDSTYTPWWNGGTPTGQTITMQYTSGYEYDASPITTTDIAIYAPGETTATNPLVTASGVQVAQIVNVLYGKPPATPAPYPDWNAALAAGAPPLETAFWGDFGSALYENLGVATPAPSNGLFAILPQLPGNLSSGFIVRTGGYGGPTPSVQIGITQADRNAFPYVIPMNSTAPYAGSSIKFPNSGAQTYNSAAMNANVALSLSGAGSQSFPNTGLVLDTGAPSTEVHEGTVLQFNAAFISGNSLTTGTNFTLYDTPWSFTQTQQGVKGLSDIGVSSGSTNIYAPPEGFVNTGITLYFQYDVMFDLQYGVVRLRKLPAQGTPHVVPIYRTATTDDFVIYAAIGRGGVLEPYLLDTGSPHTFATYGAWWGDPPPVQTTQGANLFTFAAGFGYYWEPWSAIVTLGNDIGQEIVSTESAVNFGLITNVDGSSLTPAQSYAQWQMSYASHEPPFSDGTFGNFGGALYGDGTFATILAQIPLGPGLKRGFIIDSGGPNSLQGTVTIGLSAATINAFINTPGSILLPMAALESGGIQQMLADGAGAFQATQVTTSVISLNGSQYTASVPTIFDTGGGDKVVFYQDQTGANAVPPSLVNGGGTFGFIKPGTQFALGGVNTSSAQKTFLNFTVENTEPVVNTLYLDDNLTTGIGGARVNTGIQVFNEYRVMFDLDDGWLGLLPAGVNPTPTPTPIANVPATLHITSRKRLGPPDYKFELRGTSDSPSGLAKVTCKLRGNKQQAKNPAKWRFVVTLAPGHNRIALEAINAQGLKTTRSLDIVLR